MDKEKTNSTATEQKRAPGTPWLEEVSNKLTPIAEAMDEAQDLNKGLIVIALDGDVATVTAAGGREALGNAVKIVLTAREPFNQYLPIAARMIAEDVKEAGTPILTIPLAPEDEDQTEAEQEDDTADEEAETPRNYARPEWISTIGADVEKILEAHDFEDDSKACIFMALDRNGDFSSYCRHIAGGNPALAEAIGRLVYDAGCPESDIPLVLQRAAEKALLKFHEDHPVAPAFVICDCDEDEDETEDEVEPNNTDSDHE